MKERIISAVILILIATPLIIAGNKVFAVTIGFLGIFALKEIMDLKKSHGKVPIFVSFLSYFSFTLLVYFSPFDSFVSCYDFRFLAIIIIACLLPILFYSETKKYRISDALFLMGMILLLGVSCHGIILARMNGIWSFLYLAATPLVTDTFAYFGGTFFGKHKLAPLISPKKTWEGSILGTILATILGSIYYFLVIRTGNIFSIILLTLLLSIMGQLGDLFFSKLKRENGIKDFSDLIPGHGGILDRFDSMIFATLVYLIFIQYI